LAKRRFLPRAMPLLNVFDAAPGRTVAVIEGDLFEEAIQVDLLVISAWENYYEGEPGSMVATLQERCGLSVKTLQRTPALDLRRVDTIRAWITPALNHQTGLLPALRGWRWWRAPASRRLTPANRWCFSSCSACCHSCRCMASHAAAWPRRC
jgi:hypothetical protein